MTANSPDIIKSLQEIISICGPPSDENIWKYKGYIHDYFVSYEREMNLLKIILDQGFVSKLAKENNSVPYKMLSQKYVSQLHDNWGMDKTAATWAIDTWAEALGIHFTISCKAFFSISQAEGIVPIKVVFDNQSQGIIDTVEWDFGDGERSTERNPSHLYKEPGTYTVTLQAYNKDFTSEYRLTDGVKVRYPELKAHFSINETGGELPFIITLHNKSEGFIRSYDWDFGNGSRSSEKNPTHTYEKPGEYQVSLTISDEKTSDTYVLDTRVRVYFPPLTPRFSCSVTEGEIPFSIRFTDLSRGMIGSWRWDFGDGSTSAEQNPVHEYKEAGMHTVTLTIKDVTTGEEQSKVFAITALLPPLVPDFLIKDPQGTVPLSVPFYDNSQGRIISYEWDFGDGEKSNEKNPVHLYKKHGRYSVTLTIRDKEKSNSVVKKQAVIARPENLNADFSCSEIGGDAPLSVSFASSAMNPDASCHWSFGDGEESKERNPVHIYKRPGKYSVVLTVTQDDFFEQKIRDDLIQVSHPQLIPDFGCSLTEGVVPFSIQLKDLSKGLIGLWRWNFGDGTTSDEKNPVHEYTDSGTHTVTLTVKDDVTGRKKSKSIEIIARLPPLVSDFIVKDPEGRIPFTVTFEDKSQGRVIAQEWDFGDGERSNKRDPVHTYKKSGRFTVTLTVRDKEKNHTSSQQNVVIAWPKNLGAGFSSSVIKGDTPLSVGFTPLVKNPNATYHWSFGDGEESDLPNPDHIYQNDGEYSVRLTVCENDFSKEKVKEKFITVTHPQLVPDFGCSSTEGVVPFSLQCTDHSKGMISSWKWDFGDGSSSDIQNPVHEYSESGTFSITLTVKDQKTGEEKSIAIVITALLPPLVSGFIVQNSEGPVPLSVQFSDRSEGRILSYEWDFGDGERSNERNPVHTYTRHGRYPVILSIKDKERTHSVTQDQAVIVWPENLDANFICSLNRGICPLSVSFTLFRKNPKATCLWSFGDGEESDEENPVHIYQKAGEYQVRAQVTEDDFSKEKLSEEIIHVFPPLSPDFSSSVTEGKIPLSIHLKDCSKGLISSWRWDFGDGTASDEQNPVHEYHEPGIFIITLTIKEEISGLELSKSVEITASLPPLVSNFGIKNSDGPVPLTARFFDKSEGRIVSYEWDFGDGEQSNEKNPVHIYKKYGRYQVSLTIRDQEKSHSSDNGQVVTARPDNLNANFFSSINRDKNPVSVQFIPATANPDATYHWSFGDGEESEEPNPLHVFEKSGKYPVRLTVTQGYFSEEEIEGVVIKPVIFTKPVLVLVLAVVLMAGLLFISIGILGNQDQNSLISGPAENLTVSPTGTITQSTPEPTVLESPAPNHTTDNQIITNQTTVNQTILNHTIDNQIITNQTTVNQTILNHTIDNQIITNQTTVNQTISNISIPMSVIPVQDEGTLQKESGKVTITGEGSNPHTWGDPIGLSGTNTASNGTYLYYSKGKKTSEGTLFNLGNPSTPADIRTSDSIIMVPVNPEDHTWKYEWNTSYDEFELMNGYVYAYSSMAESDVIPDTDTEQKILVIIGSKPRPKTNLAADSSSDSDSF